MSEDKDISTKEVKRRCGPISAQLHHFFTRYLSREGRAKPTPSVSELTAAEFFPAKLPEYQHRSHRVVRAFKSWASKMKLRPADGVLVHRASDKIIVPKEQHQSLVKNIHSCGGVDGSGHRSFATTLAKVEETHAVGRRRFGISKKLIHAVVAQCSDPHCRCKLRMGTTLKKRKKHSRGHGQLSMHRHLKPALQHANKPRGIPVQGKLKQAESSKLCSILKPTSQGNVCGLPVSGTITSVKLCADETAGFISKDNRPTTTSCITHPIPMLVSVSSQDPYGQVNPDGNLHHYVISSGGIEYRGQLKEDAKSKGDETRPLGIHAAETKGTNVCTLSFNVKELIATAKMHAPTLPVVSEPHEQCVDAGTAVKFFPKISSSECQNPGLQGRVPETESSNVARYCSLMNNTGLDISTMLEGEASTLPITNAATLLNLNCSPIVSAGTKVLSGAASLEPSVSSPCNHYGQLLDIIHSMAMDVRPLLCASSKTLGERLRRKICLAEEKVSACKRQVFHLGRAVPVTMPPQPADLNLQTSTSASNISSELAYHLLSPLPPPSSPAPVFSP